MSPSVQFFKKRNTQALSIIETLVVMALCLLFIFLVGSVINSARGRTEQVRCMGNLRQIWMALLNYQQDHQMRFPKHYDGTSTWYGPDALGAYIPAEKKGVYVCRATKETTYSLEKNNYVYNYYLSGYGGRPVLPMFLKDSSRTLVVADGTGPNYFVSTQATETSFSWPHSGHGNWLFADGHIELIQKDQYSRDWIQFPVQ